MDAKIFAGSPEEAAHQALDFFGRIRDEPGLNALDGGLTSERKRAPAADRATRQLVRELIDAAQLDCAAIESFGQWAGREFFRVVGDPDPRPAASRLEAVLDTRPQPAGSDSATRPPDRHAARRAGDA